MKRQPPRLSEPVAGSLMERLISKSHNFTLETGRALFALQNVVDETVCPAMGAERRLNRLGVIDSFNPFEKVDGCLSVVTQITIKEVVQYAGV